MGKIDNPLLRMKKYQKSKTAIVGIGNVLKGDDGVGAQLISRLQGKTEARLFDCAEVPENYIRPIIKSRPQTIIIVDASDWGAATGELRLIENEEITDTGFSTHNSSLRIFCEYLKSELPSANIILLGVQIGNSRFLQPLSPEVEAALCGLVKIFSDPP